MGPSGSEQVDADEPALGCLGPSDRRQLLPRRLPTLSTLGDDALRRIRLKKLGFVFQGFNLLARTSAMKNVALARCSNAGVGTRARQRDGDGEAARGPVSAIAPGHKPSELSGGQQQAASPSRGAWSTIRPSCWPTSRPETSTRSRRAKSS